MTENMFSNCSPELQALAKLFDNPTDLKKVGDQLEVLRSIVLRAIQEIESVKRVLQDTGVIDSTTYQKVILDSLLRDKGGPGATPWLGHTYYNYLMPEEQYLRTLGLNDNEIADFMEAAAFRQQLT